MNNPDNKFKDFFSKDIQKDLKEFIPAPPPEMVINSLIALVGENPKFYRNPTLRLLVCGGLVMVTDYMMAEIKAGRKPEMHIGTAAFMMLLGDRMASTYEQYASDEERERYPYTPDASITDEDEEDEDSED